MNKQGTPARSRIIDLMQDYKWHTASEIREAGGAEALRRLRELKADGWPVDARPTEYGGWDYRFA